MAYQTGTETSPANLLSALAAFAVSSGGWTDGGGGELSNGANHIRLTAVDAEQLRIEGDTDGAFGAGLCPQSARIWIESTLWPVTYRFFAWNAPVFLAAVVQYDVTRVQMLWAGDVIKAASWIGGNWFGASHGEESEAPERFYLVNDRSGGTYLGPANNPVITGTAPGAPFWNTRNVEGFALTPQLNRGSFLHAEVDGWIWPGAGVIDDVWPSLVQVADPIHRRQPNRWNSHANLTPIWTFFPRADGLWSPLGHVARMRAIKVDNLNLADVITIGSQRWMVFPWHKKDPTSPDGGANPTGQINHTGTFGAAIEYDGP